MHVVFPVVFRYFQKLSVTSELKSWCYIAIYKFLETVCFKHVAGNSLLIVSLVLSTVWLGARSDVKKKGVRLFIVVYNSPFLIRPLSQKTWDSLS